MSEFKDFIGRLLEIGDSVIMITPGYRDLTLARVIKFTPQKVRVVLKHPGSNSTKEMVQDSTQLVKVDGPELTMFLLKGEG